ncbi:MAG: AbrB/MazE/SpoVT family DNA-binding domain-containing protein [Chloroflexi bacterium]|nr:AbrB/MazE/SpoVT family DNA-binding domain-containing protein [Chloroflexota bacterium]
MSDVRNDPHSTRKITLRPRRQLTLPADICEALDLQVGDRLEVSLADDGLLVRPKKSIALDALQEIQRAFAVSGLTEEELQEEGRRVREELSRRRYGAG